VNTTTASAAQPLAAYHILITRPLAQAAPWAKKLHALGAKTTIMPMMDIIPLTDTESQRVITNQILAFAEYQKAIFISQNAVIHGLHWLDRYWPQLPIGVSFFAIGQATAELLDQGIGAGNTHSSYLAHTANASMDSEALLAHPDLAAINGESVLIFRGEGGRTLLGDELQARGARVDYCELYQRQKPTRAPTLPHAFRTTTRQATISVHSGETLANLCDTVNSSDLLWLQQKTVLLPSRRVAEQAEKLGFSNRIVAENACHDSMVNALIEWQKDDE
jgi:uroporphyrinogen-III synthase